MVADTISKLAERDWEYLRSGSLPCEQKMGFVGRIESYQTVLVFRRPFAKQHKFFETTSTNQLECHEVQKDRTQHELFFASSRRSNIATLDKARKVDTLAKVNPTSILNILRQRRAKYQIEDVEDYTMDFSQTSGSKASKG